MLFPLVLFLFVGTSKSSFSSYKPFSPIQQLHDIENSLDPIELQTNRRGLQTNKIMECDMQDLFESVGLNELQDLIEAVAVRKMISPFAVLRMLHKRMKNKEELEEINMNAMDGVPIPEVLNPPIMEAPPPVRLPPSSSRAPYSFSVPNNPSEPDDDTKVVIVPIDSPPVPPQNNFQYFNPQVPQQNSFQYSNPPMPQQNSFEYSNPPMPQQNSFEYSNPPMPQQNSFQYSNPPMPPQTSFTDKLLPPSMKTDMHEAPFMIANGGPPVGKMNHMIPAVFPMLSPMKSNHFRPPLGATVRINSGDPRDPLNRDIIIPISPLMTILEALRQAETKYQNILGLSHDMDLITFAHSPNMDCYMVNNINDVENSGVLGWKILITDRDGHVVYDNFCLPNGKDILVKPGTTISLSYVPL